MPKHFCISETEISIGLDIDKLPLCHQPFNQIQTRTDFLDQQDHVEQYSIQLIVA